MEKNMKNLLLNYAAHHAVNCELICNGEAFQTSSLEMQKLYGKNLPYTPNPSCVRGWEFYSYKQKRITNCLANCLLLVDKVLKNKGRLLVCCHSEGKLQLYLSNNQLKKKTHPKTLKTANDFSSAGKALPSVLPSLLQGGWMGGSCSNWSRLCKIAWNSQKLLQLTNTLDNVTQIESCKKHYMQLAAKTENDNLLRSLPYKYKPDCVFLINPGKAAVKECKALAIPLCILSGSFSPKISGCYLEGNQESCFLTYLIINLICGGF